MGDVATGIQESVLCFEVACALMKETQTIKEKNIYTYMTFKFIPYMWQEKGTFEKANDNRPEGNW